MPKTAKELKKLLAKEDIDAIKAEMEGLSEQEITALFDMEAEGEQRDAVLDLLQVAAAEAIKGKPNAGGNPPEDTDPVAPVAQKSKTARGEETPDWQKANYNGPMTVEIARWRNSNPDTLK